MRRIWHLLILRDNWQGELSVALFGAIGWAIISMFSAQSLEELRIYDVLLRVAPESAWETLLLLGGTSQLVGLRFEMPLLRSVGAALVLFCFVCIFVAVISVDPGTRGLGLYLAAMFIEFGAIVYQTARIVRTGGLLTWRWTFKP